MKALLYLLCCLGGLLCTVSLHGQTNNPCNCPNFLEVKQYNNGCPSPSEKRLHIRWIYEPSKMDAALVQGVQATLNNVNGTGICAGTFSFDYSCNSFITYGAPLPACYQHTAITAPSGTLVFPHGLTCTYQNGALVSPPTNCPPSCVGVRTDCLPGLLEYARNFLNISSNECRVWNGPCNTDSKIYRNGAVSIGTERFDKWHKLIVKGDILTEQLKICQTEWCDYVFEPDYCLRPLSEVSDFIQQYHHLPGCTPGTIVWAEQGFSLDVEVKNQQEKIEEAFLHLIGLKKQLDELEKREER